MNTGIGDAMNLAWKLADVLRGRAPLALLDGYEPERRAFALGLVGTIDRVFTVATSTSRRARFVRTRLVPLVFPFLVRFAAVRRLIFRILSQTAIQYRASPLSVGQAGDVGAGDRLPWVELEGDAPRADNFAALEGRRWQAHVYGSASPALTRACRALGLPLYVFAWSRRAAKVGLARDALHLVRPDGYVAYVDATASPSELERYLETIQQRLDHASPSGTHHHPFGARATGTSRPDHDGSAARGGGLSGGPATAQ